MPFFSGMLGRGTCEAPGSTPGAAWGQGLLVVVGRQQGPQHSLFCFRSTAVCCTVQQGVAGVRRGLRYGAASAGGSWREPAFWGSEVNVSVPAFGRLACWGTVLRWRGPALPQVLRGLSGAQARLNYPCMHNTLCMCVTEEGRAQRAEPP